MVANAPFLEEAKSSKTPIFVVYLPPIPALFSRSGTSEMHMFYALPETLFWQFGALERVFVVFRFWVPNRVPLFNFIFLSFLVCRLLQPSEGEDYPTTILSNRQETKLSVLGKKVRTQDLRNSWPRRVGGDLWSTRLFLFEFRAPNEKFLLAAEVVNYDLPGFW